MVDTPEKIWADVRTCTVYMDGSSPITARDREFRNSTEYTRSDLVAELAAEVERLKHHGFLARVAAYFDGSDLAASFMPEDGDGGFLAAIHRMTKEIARLRTESLASTGAVKVKALEWEDADEGMCTKWRAAALGGHYELVALDGADGGLAVNFHWGRPLSFWFIQADPDEWGPTGPKIFPTLDEAKAAAQADYERRILSALVSIHQVKHNP